MGARQRTCPECGTVFELGKHDGIKIFCSDVCRDRSYDRNGAYMAPEHTFTCRWCGAKVTVSGRDRRSRYCSRECEKKYEYHAAAMKRRELGSTHKLQEWVKLDVEKVKDIVETNGWSFGAVSRAAGMSDCWLASRVKNAESGIISRRKSVEKIGKALGVDAKEIIKETMML